MFPVARSSRICLSHIRHTTVRKLCASTAVAKSTTPKTKKSKSTQPSESENINEDITSKPTARKPYKSRIESFLEDLDASSAPTLDDLHSMKPAKRPVGDSYAEAYDQALKRVMRAFRGPQLIQLVNQIGFGDKLPQTQREIAEILLEKSWEWAPPHVVERREKEPLQVAQKDLPVPSSFILLLLLEDAHAISELGRRFGVVINLETNGGTVFQVRGHPDGVSSLESYLALRAREVLTDTMDVNGADIPSAFILQAAGRQSQTFIEASVNGDQLRFMAFDEEALHKARRMIQRYIDKAALNTRTPILWDVSSHNQMDSSSSHLEYASFPFLSQQAPAWYLSNQKLFRIKQVVKWLENNNLMSADPLVHDLFLDHNASSVKLQETLPLLSTDPQPGFVRSYLARIGHLLFSADNSTSTTLLPGKWPLQTGITHVKETGLTPSFLSSLPSPLLSSAPSSITTVHRVVYRRRPDTANKKDGDAAPPSEIFLLEVGMEHTAPVPELDDLDEQDVPAESILIKPLDGPTRCRVGVEESVNVALPERPMDISLTVRDLRPVAEDEEPDVVKTYVQELLRFLNFTIDKQPSTPELIEYNGVQYVLDTSSSVRRTEEYFSPESWEGLDEPEAGIEAISETSLDLESKEKTSECLIQTYDCETEEDFNIFMKKCATVTSIPFTSLAQEARVQPVPYFSE
ncbi:hypothetical protein M408DRAFT_328092 [Serendipita vermifera MAFF 305830]|uniref:Uncharacterized protein n=1 Tax=Serendipita vermifera MAFF 305830 TaxID=933852 RepID=A0A0C2XNG7_SERVB|nr:hypothetical protein M408DRAFT_328092 [Serendipita vermifera MAFF 305830]